MNLASSRSWAGGTTPQQTNCLALLGSPLGMAMGVLSPGIPPHPPQCHYHAMHTLPEARYPCLLASHAQSGKCSLNNVFSIALCDNYRGSTPRGLLLLTSFHVQMSCYTDKMHAPTQNHSLAGCQETVGLHFFCENGALPESAIHGCTVWHAVWHSASQNAGCALGILGRPCSSLRHHTNFEIRDPTLNASIQTDSTKASMLSPRVLGPEIGVQHHFDPGCSGVNPSVFKFGA